jgi:hypothetical protein
MKPTTILNMIPRLQSAIERLPSVTRTRVAAVLAVASVVALVVIAIWYPQHDVWSTAIVAVLTLAVGQFLPPEDPRRGGPPPTLPALLVLLCLGAACAPAVSLGQDAVRATCTTCRRIAPVCDALSPAPSASAVP